MGINGAIAHGEKSLFSFNNALLGTTNTLKHSAWCKKHVLNYLSTTSGYIGLERIVYFYFVFTLVVPYCILLDQLFHSGALGPTAHLSDS